MTILLRQAVQFMFTKAVPVVAAAIAIAWAFISNTH
jgi:hypothetical protein